MSFNQHNLSTTLHCFLYFLDSIQFMEINLLMDESQCILRIREKYKKWPNNTQTLSAIFHEYCSEDYGAISKTVVRRRLLNEHCIICKHLQRDIVALLSTGELRISGLMNKPATLPLDSQFSNHPYIIDCQTIYSSLGTTL